MEPLPPVDTESAPDAAVQDDMQEQGTTPPYSDPGPTMDAELAKLHEMTVDARTHEDDEHRSEGHAMDEDEEAGQQDDEVTRRSVYVGNVDYGSTPQELQEHFNNCGKIFRVTIMVDKFTGHPKGFAYIEFAEPAAANNALLLTNTTLRGRQIKVMLKRKNIAGMSRGRGRGAGRAMFYGGGPFASFGGPPRGAYGPRFRGRFQRKPRGAPY